MSSPGKSSAAGSQAAAVGGGASSAAGSQVQATGAVTRARAVAVGGSDYAPPSDSATAVGTDDVVEIDDDATVGSKRKLKSAVWLEFGRVQLNGVWKAKCQWCKKLLGGETRNGTKHLKNHLEICASRSVRKGLQQSTLKLTANQKDGTVSVEKYVFDQEVARKELALMIIVHEYPLSMVDHVGFKKFCAALQPLFKVVSRNTIRKDIVNMYEVQKDSMQKYFRKMSSRVAVTTDMWTANHQKRGYMAVTAHFLDDDWKLKSFLIRFIYVPAPHTAEVITDVLHEVLLDWHIERNLSTITLDNCSVNDNLVKQMIGTTNEDLANNMTVMQGKLPLSSCMLNGKLVHMRCAAHILNLIVKDGMSVMEKGIESIRDSVGFWSATPKRHEKFEKMVIQMRGKYEKRIGLDCKTRWNSTYLMLSNALFYRDVFERLASRAPSAPQEEDWKFAKDLCDRLKMFYDVTELLSGTHYVTANLFFPKITNIFLAIRKWQTSDISMVEEMSLRMKEKFNKYWSDVHGLMAVAAVLDPRYKLHLLSALFINIHMNESKAKDAVQKVRDMLSNLVLEYQDCLEDVATTDGTQNRPSNAQTLEDEDWITSFDAYMSKQPAVTSTYVRTELDLYLEEPLLPRTQELDIIQWWQVAGLKYPTLRKIARDVLAIPVTTVASESVFSTGGRIISPHRSRLAPSMVEALMCMQAWSRADMLGSQSTFVNALMTCMEEEDEDMDEPKSSVLDE